MSKTIYTAEVTSTGGRNGHVTSSDGVIDMKVRIPEGMGGEGNATNPEQLFAAGYASCFQSALMLVAGKQHKRIHPESTVKAHVDLLQHEDGKYGLAVKLQVELKEIDKEEAKKLVDQAHEVCPYSIGTRGNVEVQLEVV